MVTRKDNSTYPYFGMRCNAKSDCGLCDSDDTCFCLQGCCAPTGGVFGTYTCLNMSDFASGGCDLMNVGPKSIAELTKLCDSKANSGCVGFNNNGYLKRCVRASCGARVKLLPDHPDLISCFRSSTRLDEPIPKGCGPPPPTPPKPSDPPYGGRCAVSAGRPECVCSGKHPPFALPPKQVRKQADYHFPEAEPAERTSLVLPALVSVAATGTAVLRRSMTDNETATLAVGQAAWGWTLLSITANSPSRAVLEHRFDEWAVIAFLPGNDNFTRSASRLPTVIRKPVGRLDKIAQPVYDVRAADPDYSCKQDVDPTDWLARVAADMSGGEETTTIAAASVMAPNTDNGLFGNPEEYNKFTLDLFGTVFSMPWGGRGPQGSSADGSGYLKIWALSAYSSCTVMDKFPERKLGMAGRYLRVVNLGVWGTGANGTMCGSEVMAVSPPVVGDPRLATTSTALLRVSTSFGSDDDSPRKNTSYIKLKTDVNGTKLISTAALGNDGQEFYDALLAQEQRWTRFVDSGSIPTVPASDQRYTDTALSLLTMYMNVDQGLTPEYGAGQFWNTCTFSSLLMMLTPCVVRCNIAAAAVIPRPS